MAMQTDNTGFHRCHVSERARIEAPRRWTAWALGLVAFAGAGPWGVSATPAADAHRQLRPPPTPVDATALWAFPGSGESSSSIDPAREEHLPGSQQSFTVAQLSHLTAAVDWFPAAHPPMPLAVRGGQGDTFACGFCHLPEGVGRPENASRSSDFWPLSDIHLSSTVGACLGCARRSDSEVDEASGRRSHASGHD